MPEEGFSFFGIQTPTPWKMQPSTNQKVPEILQILKPPLYFSDPKWPTPQHWGGGRSYGRLGLPSISATRKVRENTKK